MLTFLTTVWESDFAIQFPFPQIIESVFRILALNRVIVNTFHDIRPKKGKFTLFT